MKLVILDRDGVINHDSEHYIRRPDEWRPLPRSLDAIARLTKAGWTVTVATNQSGLARGFFDIATLNAIHQKMHAQVEAMGGHICAVAFCPHGPDERCGCRKPEPGLLQALARRFGARLSGVTVIGDSWRDIRAARSAGADPLLVLTGNGERT